MARRETGVAIGLPEPYAAELQAWRERLGDPNAARIPPHVTLLPPTSLREADRPAVEEHLHAVAGELGPFPLRLRGAATFRPVSQVAFVPLVEGISGCEGLERRVRSGPLDRPVRFPYHPHVTVAHDLADEVLDRALEELASYSAGFLVEAFTLFEQGADRVWRPERDFALTGTGV